MGDKLKCRGMGCLPAGLLSPELPCPYNIALARDPGRAQTSSPRCWGITETYAHSNSRPPSVPRARLQAATLSLSWAWLWTPGLEAVTSRDQDKDFLAGEGDLVS